MISIERIESGPAWMDKTSALYAPDVEERDLRANVATAIAKGDANALCQFSTVTDWDAARRQPMDQRTATALPRRAQTLAEVLNETINGYPENETALIQLLLNACRSHDIDLAMQAGALLDSLIDKLIEVTL